MNITTDTRNAKVSRGVIIAAMAAITVGVSTTTAQERPEDAATDAKRDRYLLLDSRIVESTENAKLTLGKVVKHPANPLFGEDKPWEKRFDNLYARVIYDEQDRLYKCWYMPFIIDKSAKGMTLKEREEKPYTSPERDEGICYAVSEDGIHWEKPELGIVEFLGNKKNNIAVRGPHGSSVFKDLREPDPAKRYKALVIGHTTGHQMLAVAFSADGVNWSKQIPCPEAGIRWDSANNALWVPELGQYVGFTRISSIRSVISVNGQEQGVRAVGRIASKDFLQWTKVEQVFEGQQPHLQIYCMPVFRYGGVYLGLPAIYNPRTDRTHTELAWSPDTFQWHHVCPGSPLIANSGKKGDYDWGCVYPAACPVTLENEIRLYYGGSDGPHGGWRLGFFCLATLRPDGYAGYEPAAAGAPAVITTKPLNGYFAALRINADVHRGGSVRVAVVDGQGQELARGKPVSSAVTDSRILWEAGWDAAATSGKKIRLRFVLTSAKLYSFRM